MARKQRAGAPRAFAPKRDMALKETRKEMAEEFGKEFELFDNMGIRSRAMLMKQRRDLKSEDVHDFWEKRYKKNYRKR